MKMWSINSYDGEYFTQMYIVLLDWFRHIGWLGERADKHVTNAFKIGATKERLTNYIGFFEPIVIESLKLYSSTASLAVQQNVHFI